MENVHDSVILNTESEKYLASSMAGCGVNNAPSTHYHCHSELARYSRDFYGSI